jgi:hypothetical protein
VECDARERASVKNVLVTLAETVLAERQAETDIGRPERSMNQREVGV